MIDENNFQCEVIFLLGPIDEPKTIRTTVNDIIGKLLQSNVGVSQRRELSIQMKYFHLINCVVRINIWVL